MNVSVPAPMPRAPWLRTPLPAPLIRAPWLRPPLPETPPFDGIRLGVPQEQIDELFTSGDVAIKLGQPTSTGKRVLIVSSKILMNASTVFRGFLTDGAYSAARPAGLDMPRDNPDALDVILRIMHCRDVKDFAMLKLDTIYDISRIADKYALRDVIMPWVGRWVELNEHLPRADIETWTKLWYLTLSVRHLNRMETLSAEYIWKQKRISSRQEYASLASFTPRPLLEAIADKLSELNMEAINAIQESLNEESDVIHHHGQSHCDECLEHNARDSICCIECNRALVPNAISDICDHASRQQLLSRLVIHFGLTDRNAVFTPLIRMSLKDITEAIRAVEKGIITVWDSVDVFDCPIVRALETIGTKLSDIKEEAVIKKSEMELMLLLWDHSEQQAR